jgi:hypothetical protein
MKSSSSGPKATVIIPIYKSVLSPYEQISLRQCCKVLGNHPITLIKPHALAIDSYLSYHADYLIESFDDEYFKDVSGYNRLMLSSGFYERFLNYEHILIYQLDAFVFKDDLLRWCRKGYDYIGAPWLGTPFQGNIFRKRAYNGQLDKAYYRNIKQEGTILPIDMQFINRVGNGGFSLRRVRKFYEICRQEQEMIAYYNQHNEHHFFNEDVFWSLEVNRSQKKLKIPGYKEAVGFSIEFNPEYAFKLNKGRLPFGCHAWDLYSGFWWKILRDFGYDI